MCGIAGIVGRTAVRPYNRLQDRAQLEREIFNTTVVCWSVVCKSVGPLVCGQGSGVLLLKPTRSARCRF